MMMSKSKQPRKQRKARYEMPLHLRRHFMGVHLSKELRQKLATGRRSLPVVKGDKVKIMRGKRKGQTGKVTEVDLSSAVVYVEGMVRGKSRGTEVLIPIQPSNLLLIDGDFMKKGRKEVIDRTKAVGGAKQPTARTSEKTEKTSENVKGV
ncbi:50S ribosomal protein L24 [Candidatus Burarchaeum australiense]|nr:50S ribosomal protein L24 [Candidatus Burarchaeum australiense]